MKVLVKEVEYFGRKLTVPMTANWLITDSEGQLWCFPKSPILLGDSWQIVSTDEAYHIANVDLENIDWRETKVKI